jgi:endonuclease YncB( thermonuclease family)
MTKTRLGIRILAAVAIPPAIFAAIVLWPNEHQEQLAPVPIEITPQAVSSDENFGSIVVGEITSVYDGDTFKVNIPEWPDIVGKRIGIRVNGIDTPERRGTSEDIKLLAVEARQTTVSLLRGADVVELRNIERGKYFRIIADVYVDGQSLADVLLNKGLAKSYDGESARPEWTQEDYDDYFRSSSNDGPNQPSSETPD